LLEPSTGEVKMGSKQTIAFFDQEREQLNPNTSVIDNLAEGQETLIINGKPRHVISYLEDFLFSPDRARIPVRLLSGGELSRLLLAKLFSKSANVLVLDEPTNDLDIETLELLEDLLFKYDGTVYLVSHDSVFVDNVVTSTLAFTGGGLIEEHVGGYSDWLTYAADARSRTMLDCREKSPSNRKSRSDNGLSNTNKKKKRKLSYKESRELENLPDQIIAYENELADLEAKANSAGFYREDHEAISFNVAKMEELRRKLEHCFERWVELEEGR